MMRTLAALSVVIALLVCAVAQSVKAGPDEAVSVVKVGKVASTLLPVIDKGVFSADRDFNIRYVALTPRTDKIELALPKSAQSGGSTLWDFWRDEKADVAFTGGFLDSYFPATPAGLVKYNGNVLNDAKYDDPVLTGVICFNDAGLISIAPFEGNDSAEGWESCVQSGPLLALGGRIYDDLAVVDARFNDRATEARRRRLAEGKLSLSQPSYERAFIASTRRGQVLLAVTSPASLFAIRSFALMDEERGGLGALDVINMTGWTMAGLVVSASDPIVAGNPSTLLPNAIVVHHRSAN
jgi:hypothetical protein